MADQIDEDEFLSWMTPRQAVEFLQSDLGSDTGAQRALLDRLRGGMIVAGASHVSVNTQDASPTRYALPSKIWANVNSHDFFWTSGDLVVTYREPSKPHDEPLIYRFYQVRFKPDQVRAIIPNAGLRGESESIQFPGGRTWVDDDLKRHSEAPSSNMAVVNKGGRPPKEFWDDLWAEIARQLYAGDLVPKKQSDIENAMADWVAKQGEEAGEQTIRRAARKLWTALRVRDQN